MKTIRIAPAFLVTVVAVLMLPTVADAQRVRGYTPTSGIRPPSLVFGIGYSTRFIYPSYDAYSYGSHGFAVEPIGQPGVPAPEVQAASASIRVLVPDAEAKVWFDGTLTKSKGTDRLYYTPRLEPGSEYTYRIRAAWMVKGQEMIQEQVITVTPGRTTVADFTRPVSDDAAPRKESIQLPKNQQMDNKSGSLLRRATGLIPVVWTSIPRG